MQRMFLLALISVVLTACAGFQNGGGGELVAPAPSRSALSLYAQSRLALNEGNNERALALVREAQVADPKASHLLVAEAELRLKAGQVPEAMVAVEKAVKNDPDDRDAQLLGGTLMANLGRDREAVSYLRTAVKLDPAREDAVLQLVNSLIKLFEYEESVTALKELIRLKPDSAAGFYYLGKTYSQMRLNREAVGYYKRALELRPDFIQAAIDQAVSLEALGEVDQAISAYKALIDDSDNRAPLINHLIQLLIQHRRYDEALIYLNRLSEMGLGGEEVQRKIGLLLLELDRHEEAIRLFSAMLAKDPDNHQIRFYLGSAYEEKGELELARAEFVKIPVDAESYGEALGHLAFILKEQERDDEAVKLLQQGIAAYPNRLELYLSLATLYDSIDKDEEGLKLLLGVESRFNSDPRFQFRLGVLFDKLGKKPDSINRMKRVIQLNPRDAQALNYLGYTYAEMGVNLEEALGYIKRALEIRPDDGFFIDSLGWTYYQMKRYDEAIKQLERAAQLVGDDPTVLEHLGDAYLAKKEVKNALRAYKKALGLSPGNKELDEKIKRLLKGELGER
jgi:tetratricopeptide (TPR) repeat protein